MHTSDPVPGVQKHPLSLPRQTDFVTAAAAAPAHVDASADASVPASHTPVLLASQLALFMLSLSQWVLLLLASDEAHFPSGLLYL